MFWTRLASGVVLIILTAGTLIWGGIPLAAFLWAISLVAFRELTRTLKCAAEGSILNGLECIGVAGITGYYLLMYLSGEPVMLLMSMVAFFWALMLVYVVRFPKYDITQVAAAVFSYLYAPVLLSFVYQTRMCERGIYVVWTLLISSWGCDTFAYLVGVLIGRKKIFPVLSPKKSLEGCVGGVLGSALLGWLYGYFFAGQAFGENHRAWGVALICGVGALMSMAGDLTASAVKRNMQIKDYGVLIPGHGGIMDRFDSMIVTAPMTYFLTIFLLS